MNPKQQLQALAQARRGVIVPGAFNAMSAQVIADLGFEAIYVTGAGVTNMWLGMPDQGFMGLTDMANHTARIRDAVELPLLVDADTGFGNAVNTYHTVRTLERAGADCIQLEDQVNPKRCGHFSGKDVISTEEMLGKIKAAVDARRDAGTLIMARTDAAAVHGFDAAVERAQRFEEAGADILFVEAVTSTQQIRSLPQRLHRPQLINMVLGGKTPIASADELGAWALALCCMPTQPCKAPSPGCKNASPNCATTTKCRKTRTSWPRSQNANGWSTSHSGTRWSVAMRPQRACRPLPAPDNLR